MKNVENFSRTPHRREEEDDSTTKPDFLHNTVMRTNQFYQPRSIRQMASRYATVEQKIEVLDDAVRWSLEYDPGDCTLPAWIGMHPWFPRDLDRGGSAEIEFKAAKMLKRDEDGIPSGEYVPQPAGPWDDAFTGIKGTPAVVWEDVARISIECDAPWWVVYSEDSDGVCIEPQTAPPDAQNLGISGENYIEALFVFESLE